MLIKPINVGTQIIRRRTRPLIRTYLFASNTENSNGNETSDPLQFEMALSKMRGRHGHKRILLTGSLHSSISYEGVSALICFNLAFKGTI